MSFVGHEDSNGSGYGWCNWPAGTESQAHLTAARALTCSRSVSRTSFRPRARLTCAQGIVPTWFNAIDVRAWSSTPVSA